MATSGAPYSTTRGTSTGATPTRTATTPNSSSTTAAAMEEKKKRTVANLAVRTITIVTLGPLIVAIGLYSSFGVTCLVYIGCAIGGLEWGGLKRHLKVSLLLTSDMTDNKSAPVGEAQEVEEYPVPTPRITSYVLLKHLSWGTVAWVAYSAGVQGVIMMMWVCLVVTAAVTVVVHDQLEHMVERLWGHSVPSLTPTPSSTLSSSSSPSVAPSRFVADPTMTPAERFHAKELFVKTHKPLADRALDICLDAFGLLWVSAFVSVTLLYDAPFMGKPWILSTLLANFANDIFALVTGRTLSAVRATMRAAEEEPTSGARLAPQRGRLTSLILAGPHALCPSISPNKSVEGAVAGVIANAAGFALCMHVCYGAFFPPPPPSLVHPMCQTTPFWLLVGTLLGLLGVLGDLLESLLKRVAHVKDAGFIVPGHGGVLDRFDGLLLAFPVMYCIAHAVLAVTQLTG